MHKLVLQCPFPHWPLRPLASNLYSPLLLTSTSASCPSPETRVGRTQLTSAEHAPRGQRQVRVDEGGLAHFAAAAGHAALDVPGVGASVKGRGVLINLNPSLAVAARNLVLT